MAHSIAYSMHNYIAKSLGLPWTFYSTECPTIEELLNLAKAPTTAGLVVTMPYKNSVMKHLDELDELATIIGACNNIYYKTGSQRLLCGTNTDWRGIKGCLLEKGDESRRPSATSPASALIVGAGGASRAAIYALSAHLNCFTIYILNRDDREVMGLIQDSHPLTSGIAIAGTTASSPAISTAQQQHSGLWRAGRDRRHARLARARRISRVGAACGHLR